MTTGRINQVTTIHFNLGAYPSRTVARAPAVMSLSVAMCEPTKTMQVRWGLRSPTTEHKHHDQRCTGSRTVCMKRTARYEPTLTARRGYDERKTSRGHDFYVPRMQSNGSYQKGGT